MSDPFSQWIGSLIENLQRALDAALAWLQSIAQGLDPLFFVPAMTSFVVSFLPLPDPRMEVLLTQLDGVFQASLPYIRPIDYFLNLPVLLIVIGVFFSVETLVLAIRAWRLVRSFIT